MLFFTYVVLFLSRYIILEYFIYCYVNGNFNPTLLPLANIYKAFDISNDDDKVSVINMLEIYWRVTIYLRKTMSEKI